MNKKIRLRRVLSAVIAAALCYTSIPLTAGAQEVLTISESPCEVVARRAPLVAKAIHQTVDTWHQAEFVTEAALGEFDSLVKYACGKDPTADKPIEAPGQNSKRNTATTLIDFVKQARPAYSCHFKLLPYKDEKDVWEVCAFYKPLFKKDEVVVHTGLLHDYNSGIIYREDGTGALGIGYDFNFAFDTFYASDDPWQRNFGFCRGYDNVSFLIGDFCETIRVPFEYNGKNWMIQIWKGVYNGNMLGAEIGLYNKPLDRKTEFYDCAADPDRLKMSFTVYLGDEVIVESEHKETWWQTAFTYHKLTKPSNLTLCGKMTMKDVKMAKLFEASLREQNPSVDVRRNGKEITFTW